MKKNIARLFFGMLFCFFLLCLPAFGQGDREKTGTGTSGSGGTTSGSGGGSIGPTNSLAAIFEGFSPEADQEIRLFMGESNNPLIFRLKNRTRNAVTIDQVEIIDINSQVAFSGATLGIGLLPSGPNTVTTVRKLGTDGMVTVYLFIFTNPITIPGFGEAQSTLDFVVPDLTAPLRGSQHRFIVRQVVGHTNWASAERPDARYVSGTPTPQSPIKTILGASMSLPLQGPSISTNRTRTNSDQISLSILNGFEHVMYGKAKLKSMRLIFDFSSLPQAGFDQTIIVSVQGIAADSFTRQASSTWVGSQFILDLATTTPFDGGQFGQRDVTITINSMLVIPGTLLRVTLDNIRIIDGDGPGAVEIPLQGDIQNTFSVTYAP